LNSQELDGRFQPDASHWLSDQIDGSQTLAQGAVDLAFAGTASDNTVQFLGSYALDTIKSINDFLSGVAAGTYKGINGAAISMTQAAQAIYNNPAYVSHLASDLLNSITDASNKLNVKLKGFAKEAFTDYAVMVRAATSGNPGNQLQAASTIASGEHGELVLNIMFALATDGTSVIEKAALESIAVGLTKEGFSDQLGTQLVQDVQTTPALAGDMAEVDATAKGIVDDADGVIKSSVHIVSKDGNIVEIVGQGSNGKIEIMAEMIKEGDSLILKGAHVQGSGPGTSSFGELIGMARALGKSEGVKEVIIEGAKRTTGAAKGKMPRPFTIKVE
jgi:hypothetical protein